MIGLYKSNYCIELKKETVYKKKNRHNAIKKTLNAYNIRTVKIINYLNILRYEK